MKCRLISLSDKSASPPLHIALAIFQAFYNERYVPFFQGVHHAPSFSLNAQDALQAHILEMVRREGLLAAQFLANLRHGKAGVLLQKVNNAEPQRIGHCFEYKGNALQLLRFFLFQTTGFTFHKRKDMNICS